MKRILPMVGLAAVSAAFTVFVFLNTYEVVFNKDIPGGVSVQKDAEQSVLNDIVHGFAAKEAANAGTYSNLGQLQYFEIPDLHMRVTLEEARKINGQWYRRPSLAEYAGLNKDSSNVTIDYLIYTSQSWRTVPDALQIETGMQVRLFYKGGVSDFKVAEKKVLPQDSALLVGKAQGRQIVLVVENPANKTYVGFSLVGEG
jgi:hypothetical protein